MKTIIKHILVVDDDHSLRILFQTLLVSYGFTSDTAENGGEAMTKLAETHYDAVLLDYMMPGISGLTLLPYIQRHYSTLPVVMITGHSDGGVAEQSLAAGARACLFKPFDSVKFQAVLTEVLGWKGSTRTTVSRQETSL